MAENLDEEAEEKEARPNPKKKGSSPDKSAKNGVETREQDADGQSPEETNQTPPKRLSRTRRRGEKKSSEEDAEAGGQDKELEADEEKPKLKAKGVTRKGSQKSKAGGRPRTRSEGDDE